MLLYDEAGVPVAELSLPVDAAIDAAIFNMVSKTRRFPPYVVRRYAEKERLARFSLSDPGQALRDPIRALVGTGPGSAVFPDEADMVGTVEAMQILGLKSERQARRVCSRIGTKVSGRWVVRRVDVEREIANG